MSNLHEEDLLEFTEDRVEPDSSENQAAHPWKILVVDDDEEVHIITRLVLREYRLEGRAAQLLHAYSAKEAKAILSSEPDVAVILLDVVMETDDAGLRLVRWIRDDLKNPLVRIILRTGQPGVAPEKQVITDYEINDYKSKTEITDIKLYTAITVALRGYRDLRTIREHKEGFEQIVRSSRMVLKHRNLNAFFSQVMHEASMLTGIDDIEDTSGSAANGICLRVVEDGYLVIASQGVYQPLENQILKRDLKVLNSPEHSKLIREVITKRTAHFTPHDFCAYFSSSDSEYKTIILLSNPSGLTQLDRELLQVFSSNIEVAYENLSLGQFIETGQREIIYTLGEVVESRSQETGNHVRRVGALAELLADRLGMDESGRRQIRLAAPMHDIGKIGIPDSILHKPGALTPEEREIIQRHAEIGYSILKSGNKGILRLAAEIAYSHHERWDGTGYPRNLAGEDIPLEGRLVSIADVFDALTHTRAYKKAWSIEDSIEYIQQNSGTQFDPLLARLFIQAQDEVRLILEKYRED